MSGVHPAAPGGHLRVGCGRPRGSPQRHRTCTGCPGRPGALGHFRHGHTERPTAVASCQAASMIAARTSRPARRGGRLACVPPEPGHRAQRHRPCPHRTRPSYGDPDTQHLQAPRAYPIRVAPAAGSPNTRPQQPQACRLDEPTNGTCAVTGRSFAGRPAQHCRWALLAYSYACSRR